MDVATSIPYGGCYVAYKRHIALGLVGDLMSHVPLNQPTDMYGQVSMRHVEVGHDMLTHVHRRLT